MCKMYTDLIPYIETSTYLYMCVCMHIYIPIYVAIYNKTTFIYT